MTDQDQFRESLVPLCFFFFLSFSPLFSYLQHSVLISLSKSFSTLFHIFHLSPSGSPGSWGGWTPAQVNLREEFPPKKLHEILMSYVVPSHSATQDDFQLSIIRRQDYSLLCSNSKELEMNPEVR